MSQDLDPFQIIREGNGPPPGSPSEYFEGVVNRAVHLLQLRIEQRVQEWLVQTLVDMVDPQGGLVPLARGETIAEELIQARQKNDAEALAKVGKQSLLTSGALGHQSRVLARGYFREQARNAFLWASSINPNQDEPNIGRFGGLIYDEKIIGAWSRQLTQETVRGPSLLQSVSFSVGELSLLIRLLTLTCIEPDIQKTDEFLGVILRRMASQSGAQGLN